MRGTAEMIRTGFDTGFFVRHAACDPRAVALWDQVTVAQRDGVVSAITLFELRRLQLRGVLGGAYVDRAFEAIQVVCELVWIDTTEMLDLAARLARGNALSMADSFILAAFIQAGCAEAYTTDSDLSRFRKEGLEITVLGA